MTTIPDQPAPIPSDRPSILALVRADLEEREQVGIQRYGTPLQAHNGRDALVDAYQEALDLAAYLRQAIEERRTAPLPAPPPFDAPNAHPGAGVATEPGA